MARPSESEQDIGRQLHAYGYRCWRVSTSRTNRSDWDRRPGETVADAAYRVLVAVGEEARAATALTRVVLALIGTPDDVVASSDIHATIRVEDSHERS